MYQYHDPDLDRIEVLSVKVLSSRMRMNKLRNKLQHFEKLWTPHIMLSSEYEEEMYCCMEENAMWKFCLALT